MDIGVKIWIRVFGKDLVGICDYNQDNLDKVQNNFMMYNTFLLGKNYIKVI